MGVTGAVGVHLLMDGLGVAANRLTDDALFAKLLVEAASLGRLHPLSEPVIHRFPGGGLTGFLALAESHLAFHTYPERGYIALDVFTCGADPGAPDRVAHLFQSVLQADCWTIHRVVRGGGG